MNFGFISLSVFLYFFFLYNWSKVLIEIRFSLLHQDWFYKQLAFLLCLLRVNSIFFSQIQYLVSSLPPLEFRIKKSKWIQILNFRIIAQVSDLAHGSIFFFTFPLERKKDFTSQIKFNFFSDKTFYRHQIKNMQLRGYNVTSYDILQWVPLSMSGF